MENRFLQLVPLVLFTAMAIIAAGLMIGVGWMLLANIYLTGMDRYLLLITALTGMGIIISLFHLGRKERLLRAILGIRHSWLSKEVLFAGFFTVTTGGVFILMNTGQGSNLIDLTIAAALISAMIMTWTIGMVYNLSGRFTWEGLPYAAAPLVTAFLLGSYWIIFFTKPNAWFESIFFIWWLLDYMMALSRAVTFRKLMMSKHRFEFPHLIFLTRVGHMARLILSFFLMMAILFLSRGIVLFFIIGSIILDRLCFYTGTVGISPKAEIAFHKAERMKEAVNARIK
ncbi:MAG TPA: DmsC/YnfH family molybdoenzyme membrane anchor subunit [Candidatus Deferrimicrobium sp.]|nr:DmsC/YnfH family molybdoenzyme membrane anchor subunit [Candidatus Deferrimicrobium sp.]